MKRVVVIGAGIGGIATACLLAKAGYDVAVYEQNGVPGGRAGRLEVDGFRFDTGPSWYLMPEVFEHFFALFGVDAAKKLELLRLDPGYKVFFEHQPPISITADLAANKATFEAIEPGAGEALERYVKGSVETYHLALKHFLYTNFQSLRDLSHPEILRSLPKMAALAFGKVDGYISRRFHDQRLKQILEYPMVFLGASPYDAPALYSLMSALDFDSGVYYPKRGMYAIIEELMELARSLGVRFEFSAPVRSILSEHKHASGIELANGQRVPADIVVSNADLHHTETQLLPHGLQTYPERYWRPRNPGPSALLLYLGVEGSLAGLEHHSLLFVDEWRENFAAIYEAKTIPEHASIYLARATATDPSLAPDGHEALVALVPLPADITIEGDELDRLTERIIRQIAHMTGTPDLPRRIVSQTMRTPQDFGEAFNAWRYGALGPAHTLRQSALLRTGNRSKKVKGLYYVGGTTLPGIGLPMCLISAQLVYKRLIGDEHGGPVTRIRRMTEVD